MSAPTQREYWNSKVGDEWARHADQMDRMLAPLTRDALARLALKPGERVLDIGCGAAATSLMAAEAVGAEGRVVGVDLSQQLLALGRERARGLNVELIEADVSAAPIPGAPFDAAFSRFGLMFFDDPTAAFTKLRGDLKPGGRITFISWRTFKENQWTFAPLAALEPMLKAPITPADPNAPGPFALSDPEKIKRILDGSGWRDVAIAQWDGALPVGGGGNARAAAKFLMKIGPCARAVADQQLDAAAAEDMVADYLAAYETSDGVPLAAACWIVSANA